MHPMEEVVVLLGGGEGVPAAIDETQRCWLKPVSYLLIKCGSVPKAIDTAPLLDLHFTLTISLIQIYQLV